MRPWERVRRFAQYRGVEFRIVTRVEDPAPFNDDVGIDWDRMILFVRNRTVASPLVVGHMIHELGHLLATAKAPDDARELDFVGWEWRAAILCGVQKQWWRLGMPEYGTGGGDKFGELDTIQQMAFLRKHVTLGKKIGNVSPSGQPLAIRTVRA